MMKSTAARHQPPSKIAALRPVVRYARLVHRISRELRRDEYQKGSGGSR